MGVERTAVQPYRGSPIYFKRASLAFMTACGRTPVPLSAEYRPCMQARRKSCQLESSRGIASKWEHESHLPKRFLSLHDAVRRSLFGDNYISTSCCLSTRCYRNPDVERKCSEMKTIDIASSLQVVIFCLVWMLGISTLVAGAAVPVEKKWIVDGVDRVALVYAPSTAAASPTPVVFAFHGHGGTMQHAARMFAYHKHWPEAIVVYLQGLHTPGKLTDPEGIRPGWQHGAGAEQDRDLKFFDVILAKQKLDYQVDGSRIYSTGHSNGSGFTCLLWSRRVLHYDLIGFSIVNSSPSTFSKHEQSHAPEACKS